VSDFLVDFLVVGLFDINCPPEGLLTHLGVISDLLKEVNLDRLVSNFIFHLLQLLSQRSLGAFSLFEVFQEDPFVLKVL